MPKRASDSSSSAYGRGGRSAIGYFGFHRSLLFSDYCWRVLGREACEMEALLDLMSRVVQSPSGEVVRRRGKADVHLSSGELLISVSKLQTAWGWGSRRKVDRLLGDLMADGTITEVSRKPRILRFNHAESWGIARTQSAQKSPVTGTDGAQKTDENRPCTKRNNEETRKNGFDEFYLLWPRKKKPGAAESAWKTALKIASRDEIMHGARRAVEDFKASGTELGFVPYPASWLNGKQWKDELSPSMGKDQDLVNKQVIVQADGFEGRVARREGKFLVLRNELGIERREPEDAVLVNES